MNIQVITLFFIINAKLLDDTGNEALKNGLTPELLEALLASDD